MTISLKLRRRRGPAHDTVSVYVGSNEGTRALAGMLTMRPVESDALFLMLGGDLGWRGRLSGDGDVLEAEVEVDQP